MGVVMNSDTSQQQHIQFLEHFAAHEPAIRAYIRRLVPLQSDADDILQETVVVLWQKYADFDPTGEFRAWAFGIAKMKVLSWCRDHARNRVALAPDLLNLIADESLAAEPYLEKQRHALNTCKQKLPPDQRELLMKAYQPESSIESIAAESGRTVKAFYQWLYRVRRKLMTCIKKELKTLNR